MELLVDRRHHLGWQIAVDHAHVDVGHVLNVGRIDTDRIEAGPRECLDVRVTVFGDGKQDGGSLH